MIRARQYFLSTVALLLLASGCGGRGCSCNAPKEQPPVVKPAPAPEKIFPSPADYRIVQVLPSDTVALAPVIVAAQKKTQRRIAEAGEGAKQPALPDELTANPLAGVMVSVHWETAGDAQYLQLDRAGADGVFTVIARLPGDAVEFIDGPLTPGKWSYRLRALADRSASRFTAPAIAEVPGPEAVPDNPGSISILPDGATAAKLKWGDGSDNEEFFLIERQVLGGGYSPLAQLGPGTESYLDAALEVGTTCSYRVTAVNARGRSETAESNPFRVERPASVPEPPSELVVGNSAEAIELRWLDRSSGETGFVIERRLPESDQWRAVGRVSTNTTSFRLPLLPDKSLTLRVRAENAEGPSSPTNEVTVHPRAELLGTFILNADPSTGDLTVDEPGDQVLARMEAQGPKSEEGVLTVTLRITNLDPESQYEGIYALVEQTDALGIYLEGCDYGPESCSIDEAGESGDRVGYQYTDDLFLGRGLWGGEPEDFGLRRPLRDLFPACGGIGVKWAIRGLHGRASFAVNLYGRRAPADFRRDSRFDPNLPLFRVSTFAPGIADSRHEPGAAENPTARPLHDFRPGEVVAVNLGIEAGDWMESQPGLGVLPDGSYLYWSQAGIALSFDPSILRPLARPAVLGSGAVLYPRLRDPLLPPYSLFDGWGVTRDLLTADYQPEQGLIRAIFNYPLFSLMPGLDGSPACAHCFLEGFTWPSGVVQGPDPDDDARLAVIYFEVIGAAGSGSALRLLPWPDTRLKLSHTSGTVGDYADDLAQNDEREVSTALAPASQLPGDYQVSEGWVCVMGVEDGETK